MFRPIRRKDRAMPCDECFRVLGEAATGVLALGGDDGYPYAVPINYVFSEGKLYFHSAAEGHKIDAVRRCDKASFCVTDRDRVCPEDYTTHYRSVIAFGEIRLIEDTEEKRAAVIRLSEHLAPGIPHQHESGGNLRNLVMMEMTIHHLSGKQSMELVNK